MEQNRVYELAKALENKDGIERSFLEMATMLRENMEHNYLFKIRDAASAQKEFTAKNPPREVTLLRAMSNFMDDNGKKQIQNLAKQLVLLDTIQSIQKCVDNAPDPHNNLQTRSEEGGCGFPTKQNTQMAGILMAMALLEER